MHLGLMPTMSKRRGQGGAPPSKAPRASAAYRYSMTPQSLSPIAESNAKINSPTRKHRGRGVPKVDDMIPDQRDPSKMVRAGDARQHVCSQCDACYSRREHLQRHMREHLNVNLFTCMYCGAGANRIDNHKKHMKIVHGWDGGAK